MFCKGLLFHAHPHFEHLIDRFLPGLVMPDKRVVLESVLGTLDIHFFERMCGQLVIDYVLWGNAEE